MLSWCCEILSVRTASLRSLPGASTLNFGGTGGEQIALPKSNAQIFVLRTFVLQPSLYLGLASTYRARARERDAHNRSTHAILHTECDAHVLRWDDVFLSASLCACATKHLIAERNLLAKLNFKKNGTAISPGHMLAAMAKPALKRVAQCFCTLQTLANPINPLILTNPSTNPTTNTD